MQHRKLARERLIFCGTFSSDYHDYSVKQSHLAIFAALLLATFIGCSQQPDKAADQKVAPRRVRAVAARELAVEETVYGTGNLAAQDRAVLSAKVIGRVEGIYVDIGSPVRKGDLLAQIQKREFELRREQADAAVSQARARLGLALTGEEDKVQPEQTSVVKEAKAVLSEATRNRDRLLKLREQGIISTADVESAEAQYQVTLNRYDEAMHEAKNRMATLLQRKAELDLADQELRDTEIRAPFDGVVEQRQTSPGEFLNLATPILTLVRIDPIRLHIEISEKDAPRVRLDQKVYLRVEGLERPLEGRLGRLSPVISAGNRMLVTEADLPNPSGILRPGSFVKADVVVNDKMPGVFVPKNAITAFAGIEKVFIIQNGKAAEKEVTLKRKRGDLIEIEGAVKVGDMVIVEPGNLRNGQLVQTGENNT
jgi:RND family efflux transporter MFP subunit